MGKLMRVSLAVLALTFAAGAPAVAAPGDANAVGTVAGVRQAQDRLAPQELRRPRVPGASAADDVLYAGPGFGTTGIGAGHTCVVTFPSSVWCWGDNDEGQLGNGATTASTKPVPVRGALAEETVLGVAAGRAHSCALALDDEELAAYCWGANDRGQLGDGGTDRHTRPEQVASDVVDLAAGADHTCVLGGDQDVSCWGANDDGQLGVAGADSPTPQQVPGLSDIVDVAAGDDSTCAVDEDGTASCWGGLTGSATPAALDRDDFHTITVGRAHACGLTGNGARGGYAYCWGADNAGQLGDGGSDTDSAEPVLVAGNRAYVALTAAGDSTCAMTATGQGYCWGANDNGQLGTGDTESHGTPVAMDQAPVRNSQVVRELLGARPSMILEQTAGAARSCVSSADSRIYCTTSAGVLREVPLAPGPARKVAAVARNKALRVTWAAPASTGAGKISGYAAIAVPGGLETSNGCAGDKMTCTIPELENNRKYSVFVMAVGEAGISYSSIVHATPKGGGAGGGLPITGPGGSLAVAVLLLTLGAGMMLTARARLR